MQWIRSVFRSTRRLVGTDLDGNKYFEILREGKKSRREVVTKKILKHEQYEPGTIPTEWEAWLRGSAKNPPTHDDLIKKQRQQLVLSKRVQEINGRDKKRQVEEYNDGLVARPVGHASSRPYGPPNESLRPRTTGQQFQPGVWDKQLKRQINKDNDKNYEPESWRPP